MTVYFYVIIEFNQWGKVLLLVLLLPYTMTWSTSYPCNVNIWCTIVHCYAIVSYIL